MLAPTATMFRPALFSPASFTRRQQRCQENCLCGLAAFTVWICVSVILRYGYFGDRRMVLGPSSSRLMDANSLFVRQVQVTTRYESKNKPGVLLHGFSVKPQMTHQTNWTVSKYLVVGSYSRKGFSLWLNKGSMIRFKFETEASRLNQTKLVMIKGERKFQPLLPKLTSSLHPLQLTQPIHGIAEYSIEEDDRYFFGVINMNGRSTKTRMTVNVTSKLYDPTKAKSICSTSNASSSCRLNLSFPNTRYLLLTTPNNGDLDGWCVEQTFLPRLVTYIAILGVMIVVMYLVLKYLGAWDNDHRDDTDASANTATTVASETDPMMIPGKPVQFTYGTANEELQDDAGSSSSSSEDLYDAKLCIICYDDQRNCFFVPCGHCATCYGCAQRIMEDDGKTCPICRRLIHKVRRLFSP